MLDEERHKLRLRKRFERQFAYLERAAPALVHPLRTLRARGWWIVRLPLSILLILGGIFSFLPVLGIWMLPLGLLLLAVDLPILRGPVSSVVIRTRRRIQIWVRRRRKRKLNKS